MFVQVIVVQFLFVWTLLFVHSWAAKMCQHLWGRSHCRRTEKRSHKSHSRLLTLQVRVMSPSLDCKLHFVPVCVFSLNGCKMNVSDALCFQALYWGVSVITPSPPWRIWLTWWMTMETVWWRTSLSAEKVTSSSTRSEEGQLANNAKLGKFYLCPLIC